MYHKKTINMKATSRRLIFIMRDREGEIREHSKNLNQH